MTLDFYEFENNKFYIEKGGGFVIPDIVNRFRMKYPNVLPLREVLHLMEFTNDWKRYTVLPIWIPLDAINGGRIYPLQRDSIDDMSGNTALLPIISELMQIANTSIPGWNIPSPSYVCPGTDAQGLVSIDFYEGRAKIIQRVSYPIDLVFFGTPPIKDYQYYTVDAYTTLQPQKIEFIVTSEANPERLIPFEEFLDHLDF